MPLMWYSPYPASENRMGQTPDSGIMEEGSRNARIQSVNPVVLAQPKMREFLMIGEAP